MNARPIRIIGHGGAGDFFPGNSRSSVQKALDLHVDRIEVDLLATADGNLVLVHDDALEDDAGKRRAIRAFATEFIRGRVDGLLTIDEFFALVGPEMPVLLDLKRPGYERKVADAVERHGPHDIWISTTHAISILRLRRRLPDVTFGLSSGHLATGFSRSPLARALVGVVRTTMPVPLLIAAKVCGARMIMVNHRACSRWLVRVAQAGGVGVAVWTVDRPRDIRRVAAMGVDAIISNRPDLVHEILEN